MLDNLLMHSLFTIISGFLSYQSFLFMLENMHLSLWNLKKINLTLRNAAFDQKKEIKKEDLQCIENLSFGIKKNK